MRVHRLWTLTSALLLAFLPSAWGAKNATASAAAKTLPAVQYGKLPISFTANQGQTDPSVRYSARGAGYSLFLTDSSAVLALKQSGKAGKSDTVGLQVVGGSERPVVVGTDQLPGKANFFPGKDPATWHTDVPTYAKVKYTSVYPGVDLIYYGNQSRLEFDFAVAPGADPKTIKLRFDGARKLRLMRNGDLTVAASGGSLVFHCPEIYQLIDGKRAAVDGKFTVEANNAIGFRIGAYDRSKPLVIDPVLAYSTYLGGSNGGDTGEVINGVAVDSSGNTYLTGYTAATNFPVTQGSYQIQNLDPTSAFVTKLNSAGSALVYSTFFGDSDYGLRIAVDSSGDAYIVGHVFFGSIPVTDGAYQTTPPTGNGYNAFITKFNASGDGLVYSTYIGPIDGEYGNVQVGFAVDASGNAYLAGTTQDDTGFPTTAGAFQTKSSESANYPSGFVTKLNASGSALVWSTFLSGSGDNNGGGDYALALALDPNDNVYVTGYTYSSSFPITQGAYDYQFYPEFGQGEEMFVTALKSDGSGLIYSTFLGGSSGYDKGHGIAVDSGGNAYVTGTEVSSDFPTTSGAFQPTAYGAGNIFVTKVNPQGTGLVYSTLITSSQNYYNNYNNGLAIAVNGLDEAYVTGATNATNFPVSSGALQTSYGGNSYAGSFLTKLNSAGSALLYSTYLGGSNGGNDPENAIALTAYGDAVVGGSTSATDFPVTTGAFQTTDREAASDSETETGVASQFNIGGETTTVLTTSASSVAYDATATFTATITPQFSNQVPTGSAVFSVDGTAAGTVALGSTGVASYSTSSLTAGTHTILAQYSGDNNFEASTSQSLTITVNKASQTITFPTIPAVTYGTSPIMLSAVASSGLPVTFSVLSGPGTISNGVLTVAGVGSIVIAANQAGNSSYNPAPQVTQTLTVKPALLTVTANNQHMVEGAAVPTLTYTITGFVNGDTQSSATTGTPSLSTTATSSSAVGNYPITITAGTLASTRYTFTFVNGTLNVTTNAPVMSFSPVSLAFGNVAVGSSVTLPVTLSNTGGGNLAVSGISFTGTNASLFGHSSNCGQAAVAPGSSCIIQVTVKPTAAGNFTATLNVTDNATGSPQTVAITGTGVLESAVSLSPTSLSFSNATAGKSVTLPVTITNTGQANLNVSGISFTGTNASLFSHTSTCGQAAVAPNGTCTIEVIFNPTAAGSFSATLNITDNAPNKSQTVAITATAVAAGPAVSLSPTSLSFGSVTVGDSSTLPVTVTNTGGSSLIVSGISFTGTNASLFSHTSTCGQAAVAPNATCTIEVLFKPTSAGSFTATLNIADNATGSPQTVAITGTGTGGAAVSLSPTSLSFGSVAVDSSATLPVTVTNTGSSNLTVTGISFTGTNASLFSHTSNCGSAAIAPNSTCTIQVTVKPTSAGSFTATLNITDNATGSPQTVDITGTGTGSAAVSLSPTSLSFGSVAAGSSATLPVTVTNTGTINLSVTGISFTGTNAGSFSHSSNCGSAAVAPNGTCTIQVTFAPSASGNYSATMNITDNGTGNPQTLAITGTAP